MWTKFKTRFLKLFQKQEELEESKINYQHPTNIQRPHEIDEKRNTDQGDPITHQIERSFRFPLIPDEQSETTYENKGARNRSFSTQSQKMVGQKDTNVRSHRQPIRKKQPKERFTPTRVPSPIYGYNERTDTQKIEQVPTFMRQKQATETKAKSKDLSTKNEQTFTERATKDRS